MGDAPVPNSAGDMWLWGPLCWHSPCSRHLRKDFRDLPSSLLEGEREVNFSYFLRLLLIVTEVAVLQQPGAKQNPTAQGLVTAKASRTKDKPKIRVGTDAPMYSPVTPLPNTSGRFWWPWLSDERRRLCSREWLKGLWSLSPNPESLLFL